jgi:actin-related protein
LADKKSLKRGFLFTLIRKGKIIEKEYFDVDAFQGNQYRNKIFLGASALKKVNRFCSATSLFAFQARQSFLEKDADL